MAHRCEAKTYNMVRPPNTGKGWINRTTRCASKNTVRHIRNPQCGQWQRWESHGMMALPTEAWYCAEHIHDQRRGVTKWVPA